MKYNFDEIIDRRGTNSYKWDLVKEEGVIPMWVADMDFQTTPCVIEALQKRVAHGIFGYTRLLLRGHHQLVLASPPVEHTERLDSLHIRRSASHLLLSESNLYARRESAGTNPSVQLLLLLHQKQRLRSDRK